MSAEYDNLDRPGTDITIDDNLETQYDSWIDASPKDETLNIDSVCYLFKSCLRRYGTLLLALQTDASRSTNLFVGLVSDIKDEFSRLRIWGEQTYAVLPPNARRSLDEQLREDEDTKEVVIRCLQRLNNHIEKAIEQTKRYPPSADFDTQGEEYSSLSDESDTAQEDLESTWEIRFRKTINSIFEGIRSLYRVSSLLRRPKNSSKYLRSSHSTISSHDALSVTLDYTHVSETIRQWRRHLTMRSRDSGDEERSLPHLKPRDVAEDEHQEVADIVFFCQRLAWANRFRRKQFDYWLDNPDVPETQTISLDAGDRTDQQTDKIMSAIPTTLSTVAKSALGDSAEIGQWRTVYAESAIGHPNTTRVPDVPKCSKIDPNFECPFCHIILDSELMQKREIWKKHVLRDLRPYVCSFKECEDPGKLFETRHDWMYHEKQMHRRRWNCPNGCVKDLSSKADMVQHLLVAHPSNVDKRRVSNYADLCEREANDTEIDACLICSEEMPLFRLFEHLATHMEDIALFVLPMDPDDVEEDRQEAPTRALEALEIEEKAKAAAAALEQYPKTQAEIDRIASLLRDYAKQRLVRQEAAAAAALAKAENEKAIAEAKAEHEKKMAEAKAAADAAEAAKKVAEEELKKNAPAPDADKAPLRFTDAVDRSFTLPWHLVKTWKGMETLIRQAFVNIERIGPHVANGHYHLLGPNNEIILPQVWDIVVQPGWNIKMQLWPMPPDSTEDEPNIDIGGFVSVPERPPKNKGRTQVSGSNKSAGKRASIGPAPPSPPPPSIQHASLIPPPIHVPTVFVGHDDLHDPIVEEEINVFVEPTPQVAFAPAQHVKSSASGGRKKQVPAFTRWMLGGTTRPRSKKDLNTNKTFPREYHLDQHLTGSGSKAATVKSGSSLLGDNLSRLGEQSSEHIRTERHEKDASKRSSSVSTVTAPTKADYMGFPQRTLDEG